MNVNLPPEGHDWEIEILRDIITELLEEIQQLQSDKG